MTEVDDDDPRLGQLAHDYETALKAGRRPRKEEFLGKLPEQRATLAAALEGLDFIYAAAPRIPRPSSPEHAPDPAELPPLGDFRLVKEVGRGGMGVVYEATQLSLGRRVAVKVLPFAAALDGKQLQRFKNEAQAAAQLHHTNIVPVYAVGCERGVHFYAMQLIDGQTLAAVIRELRWLEGKAKRDDPPTQGGSAAAVAEALASAALGATTEAQHGPRLAGTASSGGASAATSLGGAAPRSPRFFRVAATLAAQAADALDHAHQFGVVHRDVKPANLLVDAAGNLWVTDFGLAQFHAEGNLTRSGDLVGTLRYMAPEQAGGQGVVLDQRTDVYGLGATLYELLALEPALPGKTRQELLRQLHEDDPKPLRQHDPRIPAELETICMKALAKAPAERYATARAFAEDLRNFLADRPIVARRPTLPDRAAKWLRRHRAVVRTAMALLAVSAVALGFAFAQTRDALGRERASRAAAEDNLRKASAAVDLLTDVADEFADDDLRTLELRRRIYESAGRYYESFLAAPDASAELRAQMQNSRVRAEHVLAEVKAIEATWRSLNFGRLLRSEQVQAELALAEPLRKAIAEVAAGGGMPVPNRDALRKRAAEWDAALAKLAAGERRRLQQIAWQSADTRAFADPEVVAALQLTPAQQETLRKQRREFLNDHGRGRGPGRGRPGPKPGEGLPGQEAREQRLQRALAELTPEQRQRWSALIGPPFAFEDRPPR